MSQDDILETEAVNYRDLLGDWANVNSESDFLAQIRFVEDESKEVAMVLDRAGLRMPLSMCADETGKLVGFHGVLQLSDVRVMFGCNVKLGVLVMQSFLSFPAAPGRLAREFYARSGSQLEFPNALVVPEFPVRSFTAKECAFLTGCWRNTWKTTESIREFELKEDGEQLMLFHDGHVSRCMSYLFDTDEVGLTFDLTLDGHTVPHVAYSNKGLLVVSGFHTHKSGAPMTREFFACIR